MEPEPEDDMRMSVAAVAAAVGANMAKMLQYSEADMRELLKDELGMGVVARNDVLDEWRALRAQDVVITVQVRFAAFLQRMGGSQALQGLEHVPLSTLPEAVSFIQGPGVPSQAELQLGVKVRTPPCAAHAPLDACLRARTDVIACCSVLVHRGPTARLMRCWRWALTTGASPATRWRRSTSTVTMVWAAQRGTSFAR
jgi:hypothetical protein